MKWKLRVTWWASWCPAKNVARSRSSGCPMADICFGPVLISSNYVALILPTWYCGVSWKHGLYLGSLFLTALSMSRSASSYCPDSAITNARTNNSDRREGRGDPRVKARFLVRSRGQAWKLISQDLDHGRGWKYRWLCSVTPLVQHTVASNKKISFWIWRHSCGCNRMWIWLASAYTTALQPQSRVHCLSMYRDLQVGWGTVAELKVTHAHIIGNNTGNSIMYKLWLLTPTLVPQPTCKSLYMYCTCSVALWPITTQIQY